MSVFIRLNGIINHRILKNESYSVVFTGIQIEKRGSKPKWVNAMCFSVRFHTTREIYISNLKMTFHIFIKIYGNVSKMFFFFCEMYYIIKVGILSINICDFICLHEYTCI